MSLTWTNKGKSLLIHLPDALDTDFESMWEAKTGNWLMEPVASYIFDFGLTGNIKAPALRMLLSFCQNAERNDKQVFSINMKAELERQLRGLGIERRLCLVGSEEEALARSEAPRKPTACPQLLNFFVAATKRVIEEQAATPCSFLKPILVNQGSPSPTAGIGIAGLLSIQSAKFRGTLAIGFPKKVFLKVYANMIGEKHEEISDETKDAASELLNMIYGIVKVQMAKSGGINLPSTIPSVVVGENVSMCAHAKSPALVIPFQMAVGNFQIEIVLDNAA